MNSMVVLNAQIIPLSLIEKNFSIIAASLPLLAPIFRRGHGSYYAYVTFKRSIVGPLRLGVGINKMASPGAM
jgi:hypothetical protein